MEQVLEMNVAFHPMPLWGPNSSWTICENSAYILYIRHKINESFTQLNLWTPRHLLLESMHEHLSLDFGQ